MSPNIAVLGAGVIGLTTAQVIQEWIPESRVTVIADQFLNDIVSIGAAAYFRPEPTSGQDFNQTKQWSEATYNFFLKLLNDPNCDKIGIKMITGYHVSNIDLCVCQNSLLEQLLTDMSQLSPHQLKSLFPVEYKFGYTYTTVVTDPRYYLPYLMRKVTENGATILQRKIECLKNDPFLDNFHVVVNCTGLGAKRLCNDYKMVPIRGQTIKVKAPWIRNFYLNDGAYIVPGMDGLVTLGGIKQYGDWNPNISSHDKEYILKRCLEIVPSLEKAEICWEWTGLRPYRSTVNVSKEIMGKGSRLRKVVHNYGHGGHGYALSRGTGEEAACLVKELIGQSFNLKSHM